ncbi:hypothetical protein BJ170DRAFT_638338 [Xylariales sp. AK1849]|nr:hypothetical protein BJ170DRAFT_638338 [Xylariales sp. AK1849]
MAEPERRRRRPTVSCSVCKRRKIRCDRENPCGNCRRSRNLETCVYENPLPRPPQQRPRQGTSQGSTSIDEDSSSTRLSEVPRHPSSSIVSSSICASTLSDQPSGGVLESMKTRIRYLEEQLSIATSRSERSRVTTSASTIETTISSMGGTFHVHHDSGRLGQPQTINRRTSHKARLFGQSHWMNTITMAAQELIEIMEPHLREGSSKVFAGLQRCKSLARIIKRRRAPSWPTVPIADLPPKAIADELVDGYLRTMETLYRILHVPTFRRDYEAIWLSGTEPDMAFLVQLKLVLAIGAIVYDEQFSLRASALRWVYEAQTWLSEPKFKARVGIQPLQTNTLLLLAQDLVGAGGDSIWISAGTLLRRAVYMGLHRDPAYLPKRTALAAEMRRRLWNTILEIMLQSSLASGGPPFVSLGDFDTEPPGNYDDEHLVADDPVRKPDSNFTQVSIAVALRKTFPLRLTIVKFLNDLGSHGTYEQTLQLDAEFKAAYKTLRQTLQNCNSGVGPSPSPFQRHAVDFLMHRYISALHIPFFGPKMQDSAYAHSRKVVVDSALKLWYAARPSSSIVAAQSSCDATSNDFARIALCGSGFNRTVTVHATALIAVELRMQLQEEDSLGPVPLRPDLLSVVEDAKAWCLKTIEVGETSIKGHLLACMLAAQVEGLVQGLAKEQIPHFVVKAAEEAEERCLPILEAMAAQGQTDKDSHGLGQISLDAMPEGVEDWDFMMSDAMFNMDNAEPMSWIMNDDTTQGSPLW